MSQENPKPGQIYKFTGGRKIISRNKTMTGLDFLAFVYGGQKLLILDVYIHHYEDGNQVTRVNVLVFGTAILGWTLFTAHLKLEQELNV